MRFLDTVPAVGYESGASVLWLISRLEEIITQLTGFKDDLEDRYPANTLRALVHHFEALSIEFQQYMSLHNHRYHALFACYPEWAKLAFQISGAAHVLAVQLEQYASQLESYSWVMTRRRLNDLQIVAANLHTLCVEANDRSSSQLRTDQEMGVVLELPPHTLPYAIVAAHDTVDSWIQWLCTRPQLEIGHNIHLLHTISVDLTAGIEQLRSANTQFVLTRVPLVEVNRYYRAVSALEEATAFLDGLEAIGTGSRRHTQTLMSHLKQCRNTLATLQRQATNQGISYVVLGAAT
jgi:hypothetical protein